MRVRWRTSVSKRRTRLTTGQTGSIPFSFRRWVCPAYGPPYRKRGARMATNRNHDYVRHLQRTMRCSLFLLLCAACAQSVASPDAVTPRVLIHGFQATGPAEITGTVPANRVLRTMQQYAVPAWSDLLATHVAHTLQDDSEAAVNVVRKP